LAKDTPFKLPHTWRLAAMTEPVSAAVQEKPRNVIETDLPSK
jgi:hypothetical protein